VFAFAGLWDRWRDASGKWIKTCSILTTTPNAVTAAVHDRMPVILDPDGYDLWLDPGMQNVVEVSELLKPLDARLMRCYPVSTRINYVAAVARASIGTMRPRVVSIWSDCKVETNEHLRRLAGNARPNGEAPLLRFPARRSCATLRTVSQTETVQA